MATLTRFYTDFNVIKHISTITLTIISHIFTKCCSSCALVKSGGMEDVKNVSLLITARDYKLYMDTLVKLLLEQDRKLLEDNILVMLSV